MWFSASRLFLSSLALPICSVLLNMLFFSNTPRTSAFISSLDSHSNRPGTPKCSILPAPWAKVINGIDLKLSTDVTASDYAHHCHLQLSASSATRGPCTKDPRGSWTRLLGEVTQGSPPPVNQKVGPHQTQNQLDLWSWTSQPVVNKVLSLQGFVTEARKDWHLGKYLRLKHNI